MHCVILDDYQGIAHAYANWDSLLTVDVTSVHTHLEGVELLDVIRNAEIIVAMRERTGFSAELFDQLPKLKLLVTTGMRNAAIDLDAARAHEVIVTGTAGIPTPTGELAWTLIHGLTRNLIEEVNGFREGGPWQRTVGVDLAGKTLGLLGLGNIGTQMAVVGHAFEMEVVAWSPHLSPERASDAGVRLVRKEALFGDSDILSVHLVLSETTRGIVSAQHLLAMKPTSFFINTSRAGLVDTPALLDVLQQHRIAGAGLDVFDIEPLPLADVLRTLPNVLGTPHLGYVTEDTYRRFYCDALEDIVTWLDGNPLRVLNQGRQ